MNDSDRRGEEGTSTSARTASEDGTVTVNSSSRAHAEREEVHAPGLAAAREAILILEQEELPDPFAVW